MFVAPPVPTSMNHWLSVTSLIYYTGAGAVLIGAAVKYFYRLVRDYDANSEFIEELKDVHLKRIYDELTNIKANMSRLPCSTHGVCRYCDTPGNNPS